jgi:Tfp pilus assembly protein PilF
VARVLCVVFVGLASCAARAPAPVDVDALLTARGPLEARRELQVRAIGNPRDVASRLALAALGERLSRPSEAIEALEAVVALGGPLGVRWRADDRARLARLIAARGRARLARGAASALLDLERARSLGADVTDDELRAARIARAIVALHHSDADTREGGRRGLALAGARDVDAWLGAQAGASPEQRGRFGVWLWQRGARRAAWDELSAWHAATSPPREPALQDAYLIAARWWIPLDRPGPPPGELVGPARCAFAPCLPRDIVGDEPAERAYLLAPLPSLARDPIDAAALAAITLRQALRGEASWGAALAVRVDLTALRDPASFARLPRHVQPLFARLLGRDAAIPSDGATADERLVLAATRVLAGAGPADIESLVAGSPYADDLRRIAAPGAPFTGDARAEAAARHAELAVRSDVERVRPIPSAPGARVDALRAIVAAYRRDPLIADRLGRDAVASAVDAAAMHATLGALFDALGDPARARASWQAAVDASSEPAFVRGLAEAQARQGDADAALITATSAAAASGDPAIIWSAIARALAEAGKYVHALQAVRSAIDLSGAEALPSALAIAISASRALGRDAQAASLTRQLARIAPDQGELAPDDPADARARADSDATNARTALASFRENASGATVARLWIAARWNPRNVEVRAALLAAIAIDDPRRGVIIRELVDLAADRDPDLRRAAAAALR